MAGSLSFLLSLFFVIQFLAYTGDLMCINKIHNELDACAITASYMIAKKQGIDREVIDYVYSSTGAIIERTNYTVNKDVVKLGDIYSFIIYKEYSPINLYDKPMTISVSRETLIGYLDY